MLHIWVQAERSVAGDRASSRPLHLAAFVHAVIICPLAWKISSNPQIVGDKIWGYSYEAGQVFSVATG
jgi:hypothetical protein